MTTQSGFPNQASIDMAYNDIELSLEVVQRVDDDDIDIDIDLLPDQNDEDYILEDAQSDNDHEIGNDDLMIDDENASYQMDDIDPNQQETMDSLQMEDAEPVEVQGGAAVSGTTDVNNSQHASHFTTAVNETSEAAMDDTHTVDPPLDVESGENKVEEAQDPKNAQISGKEELEIFTFSPPKSPPQDSPTTREARDLRNLPLQKESSPQSTAGQDKEGPTGTFIDSKVTAVADEGHDDVEQGTTKNSDPLHFLHPVTVLYQDVEYSLIATSESDDPDSYFLQDGELIKAPLVELFAALREVIYDDIAADDELCLSIEDLGFEIFETCMSVHEATFASVLNLYETLLRNDGVEVPGPLRVTLGTKTDFSKRLAVLVAGAADGKGLSELVAWDEESEDREEGSSYTNLEDNGGPSEEEQDEYQEGQAEFTGAAEDEIRNPPRANEYVSEDVAPEHTTVSREDEEELGRESNKSSGLENEVGYAESGHGAALAGQQEESSAKMSTVVAIQADNVDHSTTDVDEVEDLIDYSDEEFQEEQKFSISANKARQSDNSSVQDASKEKLQQLSTSEAAEQDEQIHAFVSQKDARAYDPNSDHGESSYGGAALDEPYDDENANGVRDFATQEEHSDQGYEDGADHESANEAGIDGFEENQVPLDEGEREEVVNGPAVPDDTETEAIIDVRNINHQDDLNANGEDPDEIDYDLEDQGLGVPHLSAHHSAPAIYYEDSHILESHAVGEHEDEINYEDDDAHGYNQSEHVLGAESYKANAGGNAEAPEDEINYETDDHQDVSQPSERNASNGASPLSNGNIGKRQRAATDDALQQSPKHPKRARS